MTPQFGEPVEFTNGVVVRLSAPKPFQPAVGSRTDNGRPFVSSLQLTNGSAGPFNPNTVLVRTEATSAKLPKRCNPIFDPASDLVFVHETPLNAGTATTFDVGFSCNAEQGTPIEVEVNVTGESQTIVGTLP